MTSPLWVWVAALVLPWAYVLPADRVLEQMIKERGARAAVSLTVAIEGAISSPSDWPPEARIDLHPVGGLRVDDGRGGRWVIRRGRVIAASQPEVPAWLPQLEILLQPSVDSLSSLLVEFGVNLGANALGRCGAEDCFVLGGRDGAAQLWVDKDRFQPRVWVLPTGRRFELSEYRDWGKLEFPSRIEVLDGASRIATLRVQSLDPAPSLQPADFSLSWTRL